MEEEEHLSEVKRSLAGNRSLFYFMAYEYSGSDFETVPVLTIFAACKNILNRDMAIFEGYNT